MSSDLLIHKLSSLWLKVFWTRLDVRSRLVLRPPFLLQRWSAAPAPATLIFPLWDTQTSLTSSMSPTKWEPHKYPSWFSRCRDVVFKTSLFQKKVVSLLSSYYSPACFRNSETWRFGTSRGFVVDTESKCCRLMKTRLKKTLWADKRPQKRNWRNLLISS